MFWIVLHTFNLLIQRTSFELDRIVFINLCKRKEFVKLNTESKKKKTNLNHYIRRPKIL